MPKAGGRRAGHHHLCGYRHLIAPTNIIDKDGQKEVIDGLTYDFMLAPGSEAPSEMLWYIEEKKLIESAEDVTHTLHNTYSLRGRRSVNRCRGRNISTGDRSLGR